MSILKTNMDVFVIPNHAGFISDFFNSEEKLAYFQEMAKMNNLEFDPENDQLVQLWFVETDENGNHTNEMCDNCCRHSWEINGTEIDIKEEWLPASWISGKEEDHIHLIFKNGYGDDTIDAIIRLKQRGYRYDHVGDFEEAVEKVCRR